MIKRSPALFGWLGFGALALTHLLFLRLAPAFHLDEAWAALFSHRIATEPGFWPIQAMSTYTAAPSHYLTAAVFHAFGTNLLNYRLTGILEVLLGLLLISKALAVFGEKRAAVFYPWIVAFFPTLVMNHRWVIEMNTFFVLCSGAFALGLALRCKRGPGRLSSFLLISSAVLATSTHVLFLAPLLALWTYLALQGKLAHTKDRALVAAIAALLCPFFLLILKTEPEKAKPAALLALDLSILLLQLAPLHRIPDRLRKTALALSVIAAIPLLIPVFLYGEGTWLELFFSGKLETNLLIGSILIPLALLLYWTVRTGWRPKLTAPIALLPLSLLLIQLMIIKPGPRYLEIPYLFCAALFSLGLARISQKQAAVVLSVWILLGSLQLGINYFPPALHQEQIDTRYHLWIFHDASTDMLPKLRLVEKLASEGCRFSDLSIADDRLRLTFQFLSIGDWPVAPPGTHCPQAPIAIDGSSF